jgi:hypothetical protein
MVLTNPTSWVKITISNNGGPKLFRKNSIPGLLRNLQPLLRCKEEKNDGRDTLNSN